MLHTDGQWMSTEMEVFTRKIMECADERNINTSPSFGQCLHAFGQFQMAQLAHCCQSVQVDSSVQGSKLPCALRSAIQVPFCRVLCAGERNRNIQDREMVLGLDAFRAEERTIKYYKIKERIG